MAKCAICSKGIGLFGKSVKLYDEVVCQNCWTRLGFNEEDKEKYKFKAAAFLARGKAECESIINEQKVKEEAFREYSYPVVGVTYDTDDGHPIQKALKAYLKEQNDEKYDGMTNKDIKDECDFDEKYWEYPETEVDGELFITEYEGKPAIKVYADIPEKTKIGWIAKKSVSAVIDMLEKHDCEVRFYINGEVYTIVRRAYMKKPTIITIFFLILCALLFIPSCSSGPPSYEELADTLHSLKPYNQTYGNNNDSEYTNFQKEAGLRAVDNGKRPFDTDSLNEFLLNDEFLSTYVDKYGLYDLLDHFNVYLVNSDVFGDYDTDAYTSDYVREVESRNEDIYYSITGLPEYKGIETGVFDINTMEALHGSSGYYSGKKDEIEEGEKQTGEFNNAKNGNAVYKSSRTDKSEKKYYGDWAVEYSVKYNYNPGKYGWNNGVFEDELPSWEEASNVIVYYKDYIVINKKNTSPGQIDIPYGIVDDKMFCWMYDSYDAVGIRWIDSYTPTKTDSNNVNNGTNDFDNGKAVIGIIVFDGGEPMQAQYEAQGGTDIVLSKGNYILGIRNQSLIDGGLQLGDLIISINGKQISTREELDSIVENRKPGDKAVFIVSRNGEQNVVTGEFISEAERLPEKTGIVSFEINGKTFEYNYDEGLLNLKDHVD